MCSLPPRRVRLFPIPTSIIETLHPAIDHPVLDLAIHLSTAAHLVHSDGEQPLHQSALANPLY